MPNQGRSENEQASRPLGAQAPAVDMRKLADKVYRLMLEDLRLERARGGMTPRRPEAER